MDVHVRRAVTMALRLRGIDVVTAQEDGSAVEDLELIAKATSPEEWWRKIEYLPLP